MKNRITREIWGPEWVVRTSPPYWWTWVLWGLIVVPIGMVLDGLVKIRVVGGSFITPWGVRNTKETHKDGYSIRFYDPHSIIK